MTDEVHPAASPLLVYVASPFAAAKEDQRRHHVRIARAICKKVIAAGHVPYAPHLFFPQLLCDYLPEEREVGIRCGLFMLERCDEVWHLEPPFSSGMERELREATRLGLPVHEVTLKELGMHRSARPRVIDTAEMRATNPDEASLLARLPRREDDLAGPGDLALIHVLRERGLIYYVQSSGVWSRNTWGDGALRIWREEHPEEEDEGRGPASAGRVPRPPAPVSPNRRGGEFRGRQRQGYLEAVIEHIQEVHGPRPPAEEEEASRA